MKPLSELLREKFAFEESVFWKRYKHTANSYKYMLAGALDESERLAKTHDAVIKCVEALELRVCHDDDCGDSDGEFANTETCECGAAAAQNALADLRKAVSGE